MKHDILLDSVTVGRLGTNGVLLAPYSVPNLVEQPWERKRYVNLLAHAELTDVDLSINKNSDDVNLKGFKPLILVGISTYYAHRIAVRLKSLARNFLTKPLSTEGPGYSDTDGM